MAVGAWAAGHTTSAAGKQREMAAVPDSPPCIQFKTPANGVVAFKGSPTSVNQSR